MKINPSLIAAERTRFHSDLRNDILGLVESAFATNADGDSKPSLAIAKRLVESLPNGTCTVKKSGQRIGSQFEEHVRTFLERTFLHCGHLRPGRWQISKGGSISKFAQFAHLVEIDRLAQDSEALKAALGSDYLITPDIVISRIPEPDSTLNALGALVDDSVSTKSPIRSKNCSAGTTILHASISCKWSLRSDRAQNVKSEALNLIRNRKGAMPHIAAVTCEPLPSRIASLALGTGDLDCVYHFALPELIEATVLSGDGSAYDMLKIMVDGNRLRDISDLPLDLAI